MKYSIFNVDELGKYNGVPLQEWYNFQDASKIFNLPKIGRNKLLGIFRDLEILGNNNWYNEPYAFMEDHFKINPINGVTMPLISMAGIRFLQEKFPNELT